MSENNEILLSYTYFDGTPQADFPLRIVENTNRRLVAWLSAGSEIRYWETVDGNDPRSIPLERRFAEKLTTARRHWEGPGVLRVFLPDATYHVIHFWKPLGSFSGWYINFEAPARRERSTIHTVDWHLDLWITRDGIGHWKDENEAAAAERAGHVTQEQLDTSRTTGLKILDNFEDFLLRVGDWTSWTPPPQWGAMNLPF